MLPTSSKFTTYIPRIQSLIAARSYKDENLWLLSPCFLLVQLIRLYGAKSTMHSNESNPYSKRELTKIHNTAKSSTIQPEQ